MCSHNLINFFIVHSTILILFIASSYNTCVIQYNSPYINTATTAPPTTTTGPIPTLAPNRLLYKNTANYHWPQFSDNVTKIGE